jgi:hypothetical protein
MGTCPTMADTSGRTSTHCPACSAPIADPETRRCEFCGAALDSPVAAAKAQATGMEALTRKAWRRSWVYLAAILGFSVLMSILNRRGVEKVGHMAASASRESGAGSGSSTVNPGARVRLPLSSLLATFEKPGGGLAVLLASDERPDYPLMLVDATTSAMRWKSPPFVQIVRREQIVLDTEMLYVAEQSRLVAIRLSDGVLQWQGSLVADFKDYSEGLRLSGDRLVVLARDGTTQVFDCKTGKTVWSARQTPSTDRLLTAGNTLVQLQDVEKKRGRSMEIRVRDLSTGAITQTLTTHCSTHSIIPANEPSAYDPVLLSEDGQEMFLFYGFNRYCAERWNLKAGKMIWQINRANDDEKVSSTAGRSLMLMDENIIAYLGSKGIYSIRRRDGELRKVVESSDYNLVPTYLHNGLLVATATARWDGSDCHSAKNCSLWGIKTSTDEIAWRYALPELPSSSLNPWLVRFRGTFTPQFLMLAEVGASEQLVLDHVNIETGVSTFHKQVDIGPHQGSQPAGVARTVSHFDWMGDLVWLTSRSESKVFGVDPGSGNIRYRLE